jgi:hypothetical protein
MKRMVEADWTPFHNKIHHTMTGNLTKRVNLEVDVWNKLEADKIPDLRLIKSLSFYTN